jgi:hypothetical protein
MNNIVYLTIVDTMVRLSLVPPDLYIVNGFIFFTDNNNASMVYDTQIGSSMDIGRHFGTTDGDRRLLGVVKK